MIARLTARQGWFGTKALTPHTLSATSTECINRIANEAAQENQCHSQALRRTWRAVKEVLSEFIGVAQYKKT